MALATKSKRPTAHHKKRQAQHHRHSKPYLKTYLPYLPMLMIVGAGLIINSVWSSHAVLGAKSDFSGASLLQATNERRSANQEAALSIDAELSAAAQTKASDMAAQNYWSHTSPDGRTPWSFITATGYQYQTAGENLAYGFDGATAVVSGWMNSAEHRANILNNAYSQVGFGVASSPNYQGRGPETIVVAEYAQPLAGNTLGASSSTAPVDNLAAHSVSRIQVLTNGQAAWSALAVSALTGAALMLFVLRHGFRLKRLLNQGEFYVAHHPYVDIAIVFIITVGLLLTRSSGLIR